MTTFVDPSPAATFFRQEAAFRDGRHDGAHGLAYMPWPWTAADETPAYDYGYRLGKEAKSVPSAA